VPVWPWLAQLEKGDIQGVEQRASRSEKSLLIAVVHALDFAVGR